MRYLRPRLADKDGFFGCRAIARPIAETPDDEFACRREARRLGLAAKSEEFAPLVPYYARLAARYALAALAYRAKEARNG